MLAASYVQLAELYDQQKLYGDAIRNYQRPCAWRPTWRKLITIWRGSMPRAMTGIFALPKAALEHAQRAVDLTQGKQGDFIDTLAEAHFANGDYQQAVEIQKKALALEPDNKELQEHMARYRQAAEK